MAFIALISFCFSLFACSKAEPKKSTALIIYMGDPEDVVKGTVRDEKIPHAFLEPGERFFLQKQIEFKAKGVFDPQTPSNWSSELNKNDTALGGDTPNGTLFQFNDDSSATIRSENLIMHLSKDSSRNYQIDSVSMDGRTVEAKLLHFSASEDGKIFSLMLLDSASDKLKKRITVFYFNRTAEMPKAVPAELPRRLNYINGAGVKFRWSKEKPLELSICQGFNLQTVAEVREATEIWTKELEGKVTVNLSLPGEVKPFSDLKQKCISIVDGFRALPNPRFAFYGVTYTISNLESHTLVDADIFIFKSEFEKYRKPFLSQDLETLRKYTFTHELGHFFGLGHQTQAGPSIMSYETSLAIKLHPYDLDALRTLYAD